MTHDLRNPPYHIRKCPVWRFYLFSNFLIFNRQNAQTEKSTPRFVNAANFSQTVILFKGIRRKKDYLACILYNTLQMLNYFRRHWADCFSTPGIIYRARFEDRFLVLFCFQIGNYRRLKFKWALDRLGSAQNELFGRLKVDCLLYCLMAKLKKSEMLESFDLWL